MEEKKYLNIEIPKGYEIDIKNSTFDRIVFKRLKSLPENVDALYELLRLNNKIHYTQLSGKTVSSTCEIDRYFTPAYFYSEKESKAWKALYLLIHARNMYNDGWVPDYKLPVKKYCISVFKDNIVKGFNFKFSVLLTFKSEELRDKFFDNFKDLIEEAKMFL